MQYILWLCREGICMLQCSYRHAASISAAKVHRSCNKRHQQKTDSQGVGALWCLPFTNHLQIKSIPTGSFIFTRWHCPNMSVHWPFMQAFLSYWPQLEVAFSQRLWRQERRGSKIYCRRWSRQELWKRREGCSKKGCSGWEVSVAGFFLAEGIGTLATSPD